MKVLNLNEILKEIDLPILNDISEKNEGGKIIGVTHSLKTNENFQLICERAIFEINKITLEPIGVIHIFNI